MHLGRQRDILLLSHTAFVWSFFECIHVTTLPCIYSGFLLKLVDFIENDALNVASCIQVLRILISNADNEIEGLEKDLLSLQNELACAENEKWHEICCSALTERINLVDVAISTLKNDHADDMEVQLLLHNKPAETLHEIVQALQRDHCQDTNGQV